MSDERPSKESLREVKAEYKARRKADEERAKAAKAYWDQQTGRTPSSKGRGPVIAVGALVAVAAVVGAGYVAKLGPFASTASTSAAAASPTTSSSVASPTASPASSAAPTPTASDDGTTPLPQPFVGTPAEHWKAGATGLKAPAARSVGIYRTVQVKAAYAMTVAYLSKALLDPRVNFKGEINQVLATLGPGFPAHARKQHALWVKSHGAKGFGWVDIANRFHPGDWRADAQTRAKGRIGLATIKSGYLRVPFVFTTAYWLAPAKGGEPRAIAIRRYGYLEFEGYGPRKVWMRSWSSGYISSASVCGSTWKETDYLEAWTNVHAVPHNDLASPEPGFDIGDPDATEPVGCWTDTGGFR
ncbi:MAG: hypothetical protein U0R76_09885 [Candidatus Nanopelagicales bacterium]